MGTRLEDAKGEEERGNRDEVRDGEDSEGKDMRNENTHKGEGISGLLDLLPLTSLLNSPQILEIFKDIEEKGTTFKSSDL